MSINRWMDKEDVIYIKFIYAAAAAKSLQSCPTLCNSIDSSPPGSPVPGTLQARTLEWVAISFSNVWKWKVKVKSLSRVWLLATPWTAAFQAPPSMGFSRQEYWSGVPLPSPSLYICVHINIYKFCMFIYIYLYNGILLNQKKKTEILPFVATWMNLGGMMLREISQKKTNTM